MAQLIGRWLRTHANVEKRDSNSQLSSDFHMHGVCAQKYTPTLKLHFKILKALTFS